MARQDHFVCFTNDKDLRHHETISIKASHYKGIAVRVKILNHIWIEQLLFAIESAKDGGIVNLRFEECRLLKKAVQKLIEFCKTTSIIESLGLIKVGFDDGQDFKRLVEAVSFSQKIKQFSVQGVDFDEDYHGKTMARCILESRSLKELDLSQVTFEDPKSFYEMANGLLNERCRLSALKLRGIAFGQLEGKVMQFILMRNKSLQTLDLSQCSTDSPENLENVFCKFDQFCNVRTLVAENLNADFNYIVEIFGEALGVNTKLEGLSLKENKLKQTQYCNFWDLMSENRSLRKINITKTEVTDRVCGKISAYLKQHDLRLHDLNLARNQIASDGLVALADALKVNTSLKTLNLAQNFIREGGLVELVEALRKNRTLQELCLSCNKISNGGLSSMSGFLSDNSTLTALDISRNTFSDSGFVDFAKGLALNRGIESLNLSKNKDVSDEVGLRELAEALASNSSLAVIDLSGLKVRKPCVIQYFQPALKSNITLKRILGKIPPGIISEDLKDNVTIESEITCKYRTVKKESRRELSKLPLHRVDGDQTQLNLRDQGNELLTPALKFIRYRRIHAVDLSNMRLEDESLRLLALYLEENPVLRSLALAENLFTDDGLAQLIHALRTNTHLNHLNILGCAGLTDQSLRALEDMVTEVNMSLYAVELDTGGFDPDLVSSILGQAAMNRAIQEHLKPGRLAQNGAVEIQFDGRARIAQHFDAAIKAWRILGPTAIRAVNEDLGDEHVEKLCSFLSGRNLIKSLNLRRNKIGNKGAVAIAEYVRKADKTLTSLELERNVIEDEGGEALLKAMQANMRMECCKMTYGNPLRPKICRQIEREIAANLQIKATVVPAYKQNNNSLEHYEESDRGPDFVRCALKSCELFKILHLSLPDNMIGEKEMLDIAHVISRNTPLRTLNLRDNVVDAKAALVLAAALGSNSHLKELDLRNNRLRDAGVAVLMEPFIQQRLQKAESDGSRNRSKGTKSSTEGDTSPGKKGRKKSKKGGARKLKMKLAKLLLDFNHQTEEALKHIYTTLVVNPEIEISVDLPLASLQAQEDSGDSSLDDDYVETRELLSPRNAVVPQSSAKVGEEGDHQALIEVEEDQSGVTEARARADQARRDQPPAVCRTRMCRTCRRLCFKDPNKPKLSCARILCPTFLSARTRATRFKMSRTLLTVAEKRTQIHIYATLWAIMLLYITIALIAPFAVAGGMDFSSIVQLMMTHGAYAIFMTVSTVAEAIVHGRLRKALKPKSGSKAGPADLACNRYLIAKWCQGQISNLSTFVHVSFASALFGSLDPQELQGNNNTLAVLVRALLALIVVALVIAGNIKRVRLIGRYARAQRGVHTLLPHAYRNTQMAWLCGFQATAVVLESVSLSEYMVELGGPVLPGKQKYLPARPVAIVETITAPLLSDKLKFQDAPVLLLLALYYLFTSSSTDGPVTPDISLAYIGITIFSVLSGYTSSLWKRPSKALDLKVVCKAIQDRHADAQKRRDAAASPQEGKQQPLQASSPLRRSMRSGLGSAQMASSDDTDSSEASSAGLNNVLAELEQINKDQEQPQGQVKMKLETDVLRMSQKTANASLIELQPMHTQRTNDPEATLVPSPDKETLQPGLSIVTKNLDVVTGSGKPSQDPIGEMTQASELETESKLVPLTLPPIPGSQPGNPHPHQDPKISGGEQILDQQAPASPKKQLPQLSQINIDLNTSISKQDVKE